MKLLVLPGEGIEPVLAAINRAKSTIDLTIFRFDRSDVEKALAAAVERGVRVRALIANTNSGGERRLRKLEQRLLEVGVTVARSGDQLVRYHGKLLVVDARILFVLLFNYTSIDARSRSFGVLTRRAAIVAEALRLFEADLTRQSVTPAVRHLVTSPETARKHLSSFIGRARKELLIYDPKISDPAMVRLLEDRVRKGVRVRIIGGVGKRARLISAEPLPHARLHARMIVRDGRQAFLGSQSLRAVELDARREIGVIVSDRAAVRALRDVFEKDWSGTAAGKAADDQEDRAGREARQEKATA